VVLSQDKTRSDNMIHKFQNIYGISYVVSQDLKNYNEEFKKLIQDILNDKKFPFSEIYVKMPIHYSQKFMELLWDSELKYKEVGTKKEIFMVKF